MAKSSSLMPSVSSATNSREYRDRESVRQVGAGGVPHAVAFSPPRERVLAHLAQPLVGPDLPEQLDAYGDAQGDLTVRDGGLAVALFGANRSPRAGPRKRHCPVDQTASLRLGNSTVAITSLRTISLSNASRTSRRNVSPTGESAPRPAASSSRSEEIWSPHATSCGGSPVTNCA